MTVPLCTVTVRLPLAAGGPPAASGSRVTKLED
jgi:hypothetical protein